MCRVVKVPRLSSVYVGLRPVVELVKYASLKEKYDAAETDEEKD